MLKNFPLFYPKCKKETIISVEQMNMTVIKEPDTKGYRSQGSNLENAV